MSLFSGPISCLRNALMASIGLAGVGAGSCLANEFSPIAFA